ncbi:hypothetical protein DICVIV_00569 [Dictyocaulus viviparus]|uniref:Uncharacterized protein n=1 Tax=Dictyocaulus viviparus TaxID=29172 RepID=A0A0D8Y8W2_DICVI|nr:hypothetical protein DICVIV_00569 [Dictyocaulus viviparus]
MKKESKGQEDNKARMATAQNTAQEKNERRAYGGKSISTPASDMSRRLHRQRINREMKTDRKEKHSSLSNSDEEKELRTGKNRIVEEPNEKTRKKERDPSRNKDCAMNDRGVGFIN